MSQEYSNMNDLLLLRLAPRAVIPACSSRRRGRRPISDLRDFFYLFKYFIYANIACSHFKKRERSMKPRTHRLGSYWNLQSEGYSAMNTLLYFFTGAQFANISWKARKKYIRAYLCAHKYAFYLEKATHIARYSARNTSLYLSSTARCMPAVREKRAAKNTWSI